MHLPMSISIRFKQVYKQTSLRLKKMQETSCALESTAEERQRKNWERATRSRSAVKMKWRQKLQEFS